MKGSTLSTFAFGQHIGAVASKCEGSRFEPGRLLGVMLIYLRKTLLRALYEI